MALKVNNADYYEVLEVPHSADFREIGAGYWRLARGAATDEQRAELNKAYEALNNEERRRAYDAQWADAGHVVEPRPEPVSAPPTPVMAQLQPADRVEAEQQVGVAGPEPSNGPARAEPAPAGSPHKAKAELAREEPRTAPADVSPAPLMAQANPEPAPSERKTQANVQVEEPDDSLSFTRRLGWPKAM
ncbi:MAG: DnaJ domain-containing protein [Dehalococcoidia bacterium]